MAVPPIPASASRRLAVGAEVQADGLTSFRVWAPDHEQVDLVLVDVAGDVFRPQSGRTMTAEAGGYFSLAATAAAGTLYYFRLGGAGEFLPDPAARFQPHGPRGPSQVVDWAAFRWTDDAWAGARWPGQVLYEMHVGTFTPEGTWAAAARELAELANLGVTLLEIMPVAEWPGEFGWGYDGVAQFAPSHLYGTPDDLRRFVNAAHRLGLGVLLDVVYNHFGNLDCSVQRFAAAYFSPSYQNEWGSAVNFDGPSSGPVREFFLANVRYWIEEFHLDGYRIDATQAIYDNSPRHILTEIGETARRAGGERAVVVIGESEPQNARLVRPIDAGGFGMEAVWNDDFHHSAMVRATGHNEAYYSDYLGSAAEFVALLKWGFLYQGQYYSWQNGPRGTPAFDLTPVAFIHYLQNHDQVANSASGKRIHRLTNPGRLRALTALWLLMPQTPLIFQGQEFAASAPFQFFLDTPPDRAGAVAAGRARFLAQFPALATPEAQQRLPEPAAAETFRRCKLDLTERAAHQPIYSLHRDLLRLRRSDGLIAGGGRDRIEAATLSADALVVRRLADADDDRLLIVNFGADLPLRPAPEPLLAPPSDRIWRTIWSSEDPRYGGSGSTQVAEQQVWRLPGDAAVLLRAVTDTIPPRKE